MAENLIKKYFFEDYTYLEICALLLKKHKIKKSLSAVKRILSFLGLRRKNFRESNLEDIVHAVVKELHSCRYNLGYRSLWSKLRAKYHLKVKRQTVYEILKIADAEGIKNRFGNKLRRRQYLSLGPNFVWHLDGYDKLKQFGFAIHGCVDGFSKRILWLEVATTNNDPEVTTYYLLTVKQLKFLPTIIRCDKGTENGLIGLLQMCLRKKHTDKLAGERSFVQGKSIKNQRIKSYWGRMRQHPVDFYIQFFKCMQEQGLFDGSALHLKLLQFCFCSLIKHDLQYNKKLWNQHRVRKQAAQNLIAGKPSSKLQKFTNKPKLFETCIQQLVDLLIPDAVTPTDATEALNLYKNILNLYASYKIQA